jgi:L-ribulokinase
MTALAAATHSAIEDAGVDGAAIEAIALDTTGSSVIPVDDHLEPIDDYYLWCDHRAWKEASEITTAAQASHLDAINWCGGIYSSEWGFAKLLLWLRHNPDKRTRFATALEHCDMVAAVLCGITDPAQVSRSICAMGHKWMWNQALGGLPPEAFLTALDPTLAGVRAQLGGRYATSNQIAGHLSEEWAARLGLRAGTPVSKRDSPLPATSSTRSRGAPPLRSRSFRRAWKTTARAKPACSASPGIMATARFWSIPS